QGVVFDDTNLHDAANGSDQVRVVLWLDVVRQLPPGLALYNRALLAAAYREPSIRRFRQNAIVAGPAQLSDAHASRS
ncbi:MAG TPA: aspartyl/asparaginyl beta-hydroxylase domain-containing protein, partial [Terriglobales bacterium]|nr:aspartyl/asparaginyl beta-hydroxylase domain-containing protein [Terriglobales bacterium]